MRHSLCLLVATLLVTIPAAAKNNPISDSNPDRYRDGFFLGVRVDMTRAEIAGLAAADRWTLVEESGESVRYRIEGRIGLEENTTRFDFDYTIFFDQGKARAISLVVSAESQNRVLETKMLDAFAWALSSEARSVATDKAGTVATYSTADAGTMRFVLNRISSARMSVDAAVVERGAEAGPLR